MTWPLIRGRVYRAELPNIGSKYYLVVSNNARNRALDSVLAVRITTSDKSGLPAAAKLAHNDCLSGWVYCDDIVELWEEDIRQDVGALSQQTMVEVERALQHALGMS